MKTGFIALLISLLPISIIAQSVILPAPSVTEGVETSLDMALSKGDVEVITQHLAPEVALSIPTMDASETVTKSIAKERITEFYDFYAPRGYHPVSVVDNTRESGELVTLKGTFKVNLLYREMKSQKLISALHITPVDDVSLQ